MDDKFYNNINNKYIIGGKHNYDRGPSITLPFQTDYIFIPLKYLLKNIKKHKKDKTITSSSNSSSSTSQNNSSYIIPPITTHAIKSDVDQTTKPVTQQVVDQTTKPITQQVVDQTTKPTTQQVVDQTTKPITQQVVDQTTKPVTQQVVDQTTKPVTQQEEKSTHTVIIVDISEIVENYNRILKLKEKLFNNIITLVNHINQVLDINTQPLVANIKFTQIVLPDYKFNVDATIENEFIEFIKIFAVNSKKIRSDIQKIETIIKSNLKL